VERVRYSYFQDIILTYLPTYLLIYLLTPWSRVLLEKLAGSQLVKKFPALNGTQVSLPHSQEPTTCPYPGPVHLLLTFYSAH